MAVNVYATSNPEAPIGENIFPLLRWPRPAVKRRFDRGEGGFDRLPENIKQHMTTAVQGWSAGIRLLLYSFYKLLNLDRRAVTFLIS